MLHSFQPLLRKIITICGAIIVTLSTNGCDSLYWNESETIQKLQNKKQLTILTVQQPLTYSTNRSGEKFGIEHDLVSSFAKEYNLKAKFKVFPNEIKALEALKNGEGDLVAARLRQTDNLDGSDFLLGPAYEETHLSLVCRQSLQVQNIKDLEGLRVIANRKDLTSDNELRFTHLAPDTNFKYVETLSSRQLMSTVSSGEFDCMIGENKAIDFDIRYFSKLEKITHLTGSYQLQWRFSSENKDLAQLSHIWFRKASRSSDISEIHTRYLALLTQVDDKDVRSFIKNIRETLPQFKDHFKAAGEEHSVPWQLAAAVAYQESHWNPDARSFTGVRGIMQLTEETAEHLGVEDRSDAEQSIWGGTKYIRMLINRVPKGIDSKDRLALALAAYNIGWAHLEDAQQLAQNQKLNPYSWMDIKKVLPQLENPEIAKDLKYGKARGRETVEFVDRVKGFYNLIILNSH